MISSRGASTGPSESTSGSSVTTDDTVQRREVHCSGRSHGMPAGFHPACFDVAVMVRLTQLPSTSVCVMLHDVQSPSQLHVLHVS